MSEDLITLLIDDDRDDRDFFSMVMKAADPYIRCRFASDGVQALRQLNEDTEMVPDIIFMDINMPKMNGMECLKELKKSPKLQNIPTYIYSTSSEAFMLELCYRLGANGFVKKGTESHPLKERFRELIHQLKQ